MHHSLDSIIEQSQKEQLELTVGGAGAKSKVDLELMFHAHKELELRSKNYSGVDIRFIKGSVSNSKVFLL